jgi:glycosyltransferase involved in cell wall biosynthesis
MELYWANRMNMIGNAYGYSSHSKNLEAACVRAGVASSDKAPVAIHIITPDKFCPIPGKFNVLYTMYECTTIPKHWQDPIQLADLIVVPCRQNRDLFRNYTKRPIEVCWEGVNTDAYPFVERHMEWMSRFVFLWVGAPNPRKGYQHVGAAFDEWLRSGRAPKNVWLYCKSSGVGEGEFVKEYPELKFTVDTRNLSTEDLFGLYRDAHAFLLPSMGEGFGLTLAEAMSTGLPCVFTPWGGPRDFADESVAFPVRWKFGNVKAMRTMEDGTIRVEHQSCAAHADVDHIIRRMEQIYNGYEQALERGRRAAARIRAGFTWDISARSFLDIIDRYTGKAKAA